MNFLKRLLQGIRKNPRKGIRLPLAEIFVPCKIHYAENEDPISAYALDISPEGIAFSTKEAPLQVGSTVKLSLGSAPIPRVDLKGLVVSQHILYPERTEDLQRALFRFSVRFQPEIESDDFEKLIRGFERQVQI